MLKILMLLFVTSFANIAQAKIVYAAKEGFSVTNQIEISREKSEVYAALVGDVGEWWSSDHTFFGNSANLSIEPKIGGCFCEIASETKQVLHLSVVHVNTNHVIRFQGGLGPLQSMPVHGVMEWKLDEHEDATLVSFTYSISGFMPKGLEAIAKPVDGVLFQQLASLKKYIEAKK
jgi:hypothetical protein